MARSYPADRSWSSDGWPLVADDLWRILHVDWSGALRVDGKVAALALGAALLSELLLAGQVVSVDGLLVVADEPGRTLARLGQWPVADAEALRLVPDAIAAELLVEIFHEPVPRPVSDWLAYVARRAYRLVAGRLLDSGQVREHRRRARASRFLPVDRNVAAWPAARLAEPLRRGTPLSAFDVMLVELCRTFGFDHWLYDGWPAHQVEALFHELAVLPPPMRDLLWQLDAVVAESANRLR